MSATSKLPLVIAVTGASGAVYARRLLEIVSHSGINVLLTMSPASVQVIQQELGVELEFDSMNLKAFLPNADTAAIRYWDYRDYFSPIASGSHQTRGMVVCPCSGGTMSAIATGASRNLIHRAADVHLKEQRKLVLVPRETPVSLIHIENMQKAAAAGAVILPASPGFYHGAKTLDDLVDFVAARILDQFGIPNELMKRWGD